MLDTAEALRLILLALALGAILPVMIQAFLTLRQVRQTMSRLTDQIEPSLRLLNEMAHKPRELQSGGSSVASIVATVIPAALAAYRAYRQHQAEEATQSGSLVQDRKDDAQGSSGC